MNPTLYVNPMEECGDEWSSMDDDESSDTSAFFPTYSEEGLEEEDEFLCDFLSFPM